LDSKKKRLWEARREGSVPNFVLLTVESPRWRPQPRGVPWVKELRRRGRCLRRYEECHTRGPTGAVGKVCREFDISARTLWRWLGNYRKGGLSALIPASRRPQQAPRQTPPWLEWAILALRLRCGWGVERIGEELNRLGLRPVSHNAVYGVLERRAMKVPRCRRSRKAGFRYQREVPNDLWHMDVKGPFWFAPKLAPVYGIAILDDCSRFCLGAAFETNRKMDTVIDLLEAAVETWGSPRQLMSDNGSEFVGFAGRHPGSSRFLLRLEQQGIEHLPISPRRICLRHDKFRTPETNGKIERFWLTLEEELLMRQEISSLAAGQQALAAYLREYNFHRRHSALGYATPAQIYCPERAPAPMPSHLEALMPFLLSLKEAYQSHK